MTIPYTALCLDTIYSVLASDITLESGETISVIDKTDGIVISDTVGIETVKPAIAVRKQTLINLELETEDLLDTEVTVNGKTFLIISTKPSPGINGEDDGELYLLLQETD